MTPRQISHHQISHFCAKSLCAITSSFPMFPRQHQMNVIPLSHRKCTPRYESRFPYDPKHTVKNHLEEQDKTMHPHVSGALFIPKGVTPKFNLQYELSCLSRTWIQIHVFKKSHLIASTNCRL